MAAENKDPTTLQADEIPQEAGNTAEQTGGKNEPECKKKSGRKGLILCAVAAVVVAGAVAVPESRDFLISKYDGLTASDGGLTAEEATVSEAAETEGAGVADSFEDEVQSRLEQLENAREFENAETVLASVEPETLSSDAQEIAELRKNYEQALLNIAALNDRLSALLNEQNRRFDELQKAMPQKGLLEERLLSLSSKEDGLAKQVADNNRRTELLEQSKADASSVLRLIARMDQAELKIRESAIDKERSAAILLALYQLREAAFSGQPFQTEYQTVAALSSTRPALLEKVRRLAFAADTGVWTLPALRDSYEGFADKAALSLRKSHENKWWHKAADALRNLVVIRRIDVADDDVSADTVLAGAGRAVQNGDLQTAVIILKKLEGSPASIMNEWTAAAERYVLVRQGITESVSAALGVLYAKGE